MWTLNMTKQEGNKRVVVFLDRQAAEIDQRVVLLHTRTHTPLAIQQKRATGQPCHNQVGHDHELSDQCTELPGL